MNGKLLIKIVIILVLSIVCLFAILISKQQSEKQAILSQTIKPQITDLAVKKIISGNLYPFKEIEIKSSVSGILEEFYVEIGDKVSIGDKIAKIKMLPEPSQLENAKRNVKTAFFIYENYKSNYKRDSILFAKGVISATDFEAISREYFVSRENYKSNINQLSLLEEGYISASNISNVILSTGMGTIIDLPLTEGTPISERNNFREGSTIALVAQLDSFLFKGKVLEKDIITLYRGMEINVTPTSNPEYTVNAIIKKISPKGYLEHGMTKYEIEAITYLPDSLKIYSGFNAIAEYVICEKRNVYTIPEKYIHFANDSIYVSIYKDGSVKKRFIEIGISDGIYVEIISGIEANENILIPK